MLRTIRELKAPPKMVLARLSSNQRGSLRLTAKLPTEIDDWMLFGRWTKYTRLPFSVGGTANERLGTSRRVHVPNAFSVAENTRSGSTAPTTSRNALFGR